MGTLLHDVRYAWRTLIHRPSFLVISVLALMLGIGSNTAIFSVVNSVLLRPLPFPEPDRMVLVAETQPGINLASISAPQFVDWKSQSQSFAPLVAFANVPLNLTGLDRPVQLTAVEVSDGFFELTRVAPALGRKLSADASAGLEVVISHALWQRQFASNPKLIGTSITLDGRSYTVVGVMPPGFEFPRRIDLWVMPRNGIPEVPVVGAADLLHDRGSHYLQTMGRLKPGVSLAQAQAEMAAIGERLAKQYADEALHGVAIRSLEEEMLGRIRQSLWILLGAVAFVLVIACANVANLLLARGASRKREMAIRIALGASRGRLIRQLLVESVMLAAIGGGLGLLLAYWGVDLLVGMSNGIPRAKEISVDGPVLAFTAGLALLAGLGFGLLPALFSSEADPQLALQEGGRSGQGLRKNKLRSGLVIAETALALVLLVGAGLLIRSFARLQAVEPGFDPEGVLTATVSLPPAMAGQPAQVGAFFTDVTRAIAAAPGVKAAGVVGMLPLLGSDRSGDFVIQGRGPAPADGRQITRQQATSPDYFKAMGIPLVRGRAFSDADRPGTPAVVLVNQRFAKLFFPDEDPIGKRISYDTAAATGWMEIVGVVGDIRAVRLTEDPIAEVYRPLQQEPWSRMTVVVRGSGDALRYAPVVRTAVATLAPELPIATMQSMDEVLSQTLASKRFAMVLLGIFAGVALVLAVLGIYGVMSYSVAQRTHEIGVRMALGAAGETVVRMVVGQGMALALTGVGLGLLASLGLSRMMASLLYGVGTMDAVTFAGVGALLATAALVACYIPARRATRVSPVIAMRGD